MLRLKRPVSSSIGVQVTIKQFVPRIREKKKIGKRRRRRRR